MGLPRQIDRCPGKQHNRKRDLRKRENERTQAATREKRTEQMRSAFDFCYPAMHKSLSSNANDI